MSTSVDVPIRTIHPIVHDLRQILRLSAHQGSRHHESKEHPTISQYARWCGCTPQLLGKFANGKSKSLGHEIVDDLAALTGLFPSATREQRMVRLRQADIWMASPELRAEFPRVRHFVLR
ncbi:hypothetical protein [Novipirellula artificiosorum]|uniref:Uncharacterized protein n=1 Tax=Novipirellula artificiosorum TaxID=2528016 RepID=A0A5C6DAF6_9BACT|nr:hypothetical protein [Novipirellula artificiosorum]TWU33880.1 hypothetical protein Poly41_48800 [Novipirellula artificiosorum]